MKSISIAGFFLICFFSFHLTYAQDSTVRAEPDVRTLMQDTTIYLEGSFIVRNVYAVKDSLIAAKIWASKMRDTVVELETSFVVRNVYFQKDSILAAENKLSTRDSLARALNDSLSAIGAALLHTADMQDTVILLDPKYSVRNFYAYKDSLSAMRDSARAEYERLASMQDTTVSLDPGFIVVNRYVSKDLADSRDDSLRAIIALSESMQDTIIEKDPAFVVRFPYAARDRLEEIKDSIEWPMKMHDTTITLEQNFLVRDLYPYKDSVEQVRDSLSAIADSAYSDSLTRHWAGWKEYGVKPDHSFTINSRSVLKGKSKSELEYNIADFYLTLNGEPVNFDSLNYFPAACLGFRYDDTLLLNSGLGKVGVGVGIKVIDGKFTSTLHANLHNTEVFKISSDDSVYLTSVVLEPITQTLNFKYYPDGSRNEVLIGEYQASYKKFYQKNDKDEDEPRKYTVRIIFRCRVSGGINSLR